MFQAHPISKDHSTGNAILFRPARMKLDRLVRVHLFMWYHQADRITLSEIGRAFGKEAVDDWGKILCDRVKILRPICRAARVGGPTIEEYPVNAEPHVYHNDRYRVYAMVDLKAVLDDYLRDARAWYTARILWWAKLNEHQIATRTGSAEGLYERIAKMTGHALATLADSLYHGTEPMDSAIRDVQKQILQLGPDGWAVFLQPFGDVIEYIRFQGQADVGPIPEVHAEPLSAKSDDAVPETEEPGKAAGGKRGDHGREVAEGGRVIQLPKIPRWAMIAAAVAVCFVGFAGAGLMISGRGIYDLVEYFGPKEGSYLKIDEKDIEGRVAKAYSHYANGDFPSARKEAFEVLGVAEGKNRADAYYLLGMIHTQAGKYFEAEGLLNLARRYFTETEDWINLHLSFRELGRNSLESGNVTKADRYLERSLDYYNKSNSRYKFAYKSYWYGVKVALLLRLGDHSTALVYAKERFAYFKKGTKGREWAKANIDLGLSYALAGDTDQALFFTQNGREELHSLDDHVYLQYAKLNDIAIGLQNNASNVKGLIGEVENFADQNRLISLKAQLETILGTLQSGGT